MDLSICMLLFVIRTHCCKSDFINTLIFSGEEDPEELLRTDFTCRPLHGLIHLDMYLSVDLAVISQYFVI